MLNLHCDVVHCLHYRPQGCRKNGVVHINAAGKCRSMQLRGLMKQESGQMTVDECIEEEKA